MNTKILIWQPKHERDGKKNLDEFIRFAKEELTIYSDQSDEYGIGWNAVKWKTNHPNRSFAMVFGFSSNPYKIDEPFKNPFMDFAKAFIRQEQTITENKNIGDWMVVLRMLYKALESASTNAIPSILDLSAETQTSIENALRQQSLDEAKKYHYGGKLEKLYKWLSDKKIITNLPDWKNPFKKPKNKVERLDKESVKWREERCPSMHQMLSLADCFAKAVTTKDRYFTSLLVMLCFAPGRAHELNSLTINSLQQDDDGKYFVSWHSGKGFGYTKKWIPTVMVDIVKEAFARLIEIGEPARKAAKFAFDNPGKFMFDDEDLENNALNQSLPLTPFQFATLMSISPTNSKGKEFSWETFPQKWIKELLSKGVPTYSSLSNYIIDKYKNSDWPINPLTERPVWENLCLIREYELHDDFSTRKFSWVNPNVNQINDQISKRTTNVKTLWERFGIKDENGEEIELTSHQLRVWLNTHAMNGGMDSYLLATWSGRADSSQNKAYDARTRDEKERLIKDVLALDYKIEPTPLQLHKINLPVTLKSLGVNRDGVADFTGLGFCVHNFAQTPCTKSGECITCKEHVCVKGLPDSLESLIQLEYLICEQFELAKNAADDLTFGADRWVTHLGWKLAHIRTLISKFQDSSILEGTLIRIPVEHDPSPTRRVLMSKGMQTEVQSETEIPNQLSSKIKSLGLI